MKAMDLKQTPIESTAVLKLDYDEVIKRIRTIPQTFKALQSLITDNFPLRKRRIEVVFIVTEFATRVV